MLLTFDIIETSDDNREKLQAMELFKNTHLVKLELLSNATTIDSALNYIISKQQEQHKRLALDPNSNDDNNNNGKGQLTTGRQKVCVLLSANLTLNYILIIFDP